jgi:hypothetical protein
MIKMTKFKIDPNPHPHHHIWSDPVDFTCATMGEFKEWAGDSWLRVAAWVDDDADICKFTGVVDPDIGSFGSINKYGCTNWWNIHDFWQRDEYKPPGILKQMKAISAKQDEGVDAYIRAYLQSTGKRIEDLKLITRTKHDGLDIIVEHWLESI